MAFPTGRATDMVITLPINVDEETGSSVLVWGVGIQLSTDDVAAGVLNVKACFLPGSATPTAIPELAGNESLSFAFGTVSEKRMVYAQTANPLLTLPASANGLLVAKISHSASANTTRLLRVGFKLS
jgi:hypothetical protein